MYKAKFKNKETDCSFHIRRAAWRSIDDVNHHFCLVLTYYMITEAPLVWANIQGKLNLIILHILGTAPLIGSDGLPRVCLREGARGSCLAPFCSLLTRPNPPCLSVQPHPTLYLVRFYMIIFLSKACHYVVFRVFLFSRFASRFRFLFLFVSLFYVPHSYFSPFILCDQYIDEDEAVLFLPLSSSLVLILAGSPSDVIGKLHKHRALDGQRSVKSLKNTNWFREEMLPHSPDWQGRA